MYMQWWYVWPALSCTRVLSRCLVRGYSLSMDWRIWRGYGITDDGRHDRRVAPLTIKIPLVVGIPAFDDTVVGFQQMRTQPAGFKTTHAQHEAVVLQLGCYLVT
jgi:hypothetical protein